MEESKVCDLKDVYIFLGTLEVFFFSILFVGIYPFAYKTSIDWKCYYETTPINYVALVQLLFNKHYCTAYTHCACCNQQLINKNNL